MKQFNSVAMDVTLETACEIHNGPTGYPIYTVYATNTVYGEDTTFRIRIDIVSKVSEKQLSYLIPGRSFIFIGMLLGDGQGGLFLKARDFQFSSSSRPNNDAGNGNQSTNYYNKSNTQPAAYKPQPQQFNQQAPYQPQVQQGNYNKPAPYQYQQAPQPNVGAYNSSGEPATKANYIPQNNPFKQPTVVKPVGGAFNGGAGWTDNEDSNELYEDPDQ